MLSQVLDRISFWSLFLVVVLLPAFFLPFSKIPIETSKSLLLVVGLTTSLIFWAAARFSDGKVWLPKSYVLLAGVGLVVSFLVSSILSSAPAVSFFGVMFDMNTFWFIFSAFMLMLLSALIFRDDKRSNMVLYGLVVSSAFVLVLQLFRFFLPGPLSFGLLGAKTANIFGSWNSFGIFVGFVSVVSLFVLELLHLPKNMKRALSAFVIFSVIMAAVVNFYLVWEIMGIFALLIFVYKISISSNKGHEDRKASFPAFSFGVIMVSLLFFISGQFIGGFLPAKLGLGEIEISPSLSSTASVTYQALKHDPVFGLGPNRFGETWALYKPDVINYTQFWNTAFGSGSGLIPSYVATNGILGLLALLSFFGFFLLMGVKILFSSIKHGESSPVSVFFIAALYLFVASFFYSVGVAVLLLAFAMTGIFIGLSASKVEKGEFNVSFLDDPRKSFFSILFLVLIMIASAGVSFKFMERFASVYYYQEALSASSLDLAESSINKALALHKNDLYFRTYSDVYLARINMLVSKEGELTEIEKSQLKQSLAESVNGATLATEYNKNNYLNFQSLASVYQATGNLGVEGSLDKAIEAYNQALVLNPKNPGLKLSIATVYLAQNKTKEAKDFALEALKLKPDYLDGLIIMSRIEKDLGNKSEAVAYAEAALSLLPQNEDLQKYVTSLKNGNPINPPTITEEKDTKSQ